MAELSSKELNEIMAAAQLGNLNTLPLELRRSIYRFVHAPIDKIDFPAIKKRAGIADDKPLFMAVWLFSVKLEELQASKKIREEMSEEFEFQSTNFPAAAFIQLYDNRHAPAAFFTAHLCIEDLGAVDYTQVAEVKLCFPRLLSIEFGRLVPQTDKYYLSYAIYPCRGVQRFPVLEVFPDGRGVTIRTLLVDDDCPNLPDQCDNESPPDVCNHGGDICPFCSLITVITPTISVQADSARGPLAVHNNLPPLAPWEYYNILPRWSLPCHRKPLYHTWTTAMQQQLGSDAVWITPSGDIARGCDIGL